MCILLVSSALVAGMQAVPAYPGWQTMTQPDGSRITVRQVGDEFYNYWQTDDGRLAIRQPDGSFVRSSQPLPTSEMFRTRRAKARTAMAARAPQTIGVPALAPRGVVILVNFSDSKMDSTHTQAVFDDMCNAVNCTTNAYKGKNYGSAAQYFADQSNGTYRPVFDVIGPVNLAHPVAYYGEDVDNEGYIDYSGYAADFVIEAVLAADSLGCDFSQYDTDNDGKVDFVYFIYAGMGQSAGGSEETIWPHNATLKGQLYAGHTHGESGYYYNNSTDNNLLVLDGKMIDNYACSAELYVDGTLGGIGTLCHEFGHVLGLPDTYDTSDMSNYDTPMFYDVMDLGSYNGAMHCPANYNIWEKGFFGWGESVNLGDSAATVTLYANGTPEYNACQVNISGKQQAIDAIGECFYVENRQQIGWDEHLPTHGLLVWRVYYDYEAWRYNEVNVADEEQGEMMRYMLVAKGDSAWTDLPARPITDVQENDGVLTFRYMDSAAIVPVPDFEPQWQEWAYYCESAYVVNFGSGENKDFYWGIMFPERSIASDTLTMISIYEATEYNTQPITLDVYYGDDRPCPVNRIYSQTFNPMGADGWHELTLNEPIVFSHRYNLWIILHSSDEFPAAVCEDTHGDPNGCLYSENGLSWDDQLIEDEVSYVVMVKAHFGSIPASAGPATAVTNTLTPPTDSRVILRDGQLLIIRDGLTYTLLGASVR